MCHRDFLNRFRISLETFRCAFVPRKRGRRLRFRRVREQIPRGRNFPMEKLYREDRLRCTVERAPGKVITRIPELF